VPVVDPDKPFLPSLAQQRYLAAWLDPNSPHSILGLAKLVKVNRRTVYDWLDDQRFCTWFAAAAERFFQANKHTMWKKCLELAIEGSPDHIKLIAQRSGELRPDVQSVNGDRPGALQIFLNVPRPNQLQPAPPEPDTIDLQPLVLPTHPSIEEH
jgi:Helix-turn-helix of insertion element transposase